ncbi:Seipin domain-containing protein [Phanerochaete sordida]|uniref:Seipin domain-containing protein n=1 Tax=Phanerochaete sordida TaxID=48140 RepID=A0A9P3G3X9_9APHY|nr:Seipin domain-containing protein [Phanerochaete sordida]
MDEEEKYAVSPGGTTQDAFADYPFVLRVPLKLCAGFLSSGFRFIRPYAPQLVPLAVFVCAIPALLFFSFSSGWFVWRSIAVGWEVPLYLQYGDGPSPYAHVALPPLVSRQAYDVSLHLQVPTSPSNLELGNFMASLTIATASNQTLAVARRPALVLPMTSTPFSFVWTKPGVIELTIPMLTNVEMAKSGASAHVEIGRRDQWKTIRTGEGRELSVSSAMLRGVVVHHGLRGILTRFPLLTSMLAAASFFFISFVILASCILPAVEWQFHEEPQPIEPAVYEKPRRARRRPRDESKIRRGVPRRSPSHGSSSRTSFSVTQQQEPQGIKTEDIPIEFPSETTPLRRRRSRLSQPSESEE